jgi:hypothetical protein
MENKCHDTNISFFLLFVKKIKKIAIFQYSYDKTLKI